MKKLAIAMTVILVIGIILVAIGCAVYFSSGLRFGSKEIEYTEKSFESEDSFSSIKLDLDDAHRVLFQRGEKCSVQYSESEFSNVTVSVANGVLSFDERGKNSWNWLERLIYNFKTTDIVITVPDEINPNITGIFDGAVELSLPSWELGDIDLRVRGAANINGSDVVAKNVNLNISGATNIQLTGKADLLKIHASGAVNMRCDNIECPHLEVSASGSAHLNLSGVGNSLNVHVSGAAKVWAKDFKLSTAVFDVSGSLNAEVTVNNTLNVHASGSGKIYYWGNPFVEQSGSGSLKVTHQN